MIIFVPALFVQVLASPCKTDIRRSLYILTITTRGARLTPRTYHHHGRSFSVAGRIAELTDNPVSAFICGSPIQLKLPQFQTPTPISSTIDEINTSGKYNTPPLSFKTSLDAITVRYGSYFSIKFIKDFVLRW